jgi:hypothetical protein
VNGCDGLQSKNEELQGAAHNMWMESGTTYREFQTIKKILFVSVGCFFYNITMIRAHTSFEGKICMYVPFIKGEICNSHCETLELVFFYRYFIFFTRVTYFRI